MTSVDSDGALIHRYAEDRDELAFAALVERHGKLVWGVGLRMLRRREDAEDAFQAVFLVLARRAKSLTKEVSLAAWLHGVTIRVCLAQGRAERRRQQQIQRAAETVKDEEEMYERETLRALIDQELRTIPLRYREVLIMCDIEGFTREEVASRLSVPTGTISSRLSRGRERLKRRLVKQGLVVAGGSAALLTSLHATAAPSSQLFESTLHNADAFAWGAAAAKASINVRVLTLAEGVLRTMLLAKWKTAVCVAMLMGASLFTGFGSLGGQESARAGNIYKDSFNDDSISDNAPVTWTPVLDGWPSTDYDIVDGNLQVFSSKPGESAFLADFDNETRDLSIRARVRVDSDVNESAAVFVRGAGKGVPAAYLEIDSAGRLWYFSDSGVYGQYMNTALRPGDEDVILQVDAFGDTETYWVWRAADPKPSNPILQRTSTLSGVGVPGIAYGIDADVASSANSGAAIFRYVQVADTPIGVPEPSGGSICAIGGTVLSFGLLFQRRRYRP